jgi:hypothetical protein
MSGIKLYYVVNKDLKGSGMLDMFGMEVEETTGLKYITVYEMINNEPKEFFCIEIYNEENSEEAIQQYLNVNGYSDKLYEFILL